MVRFLAFVVVVLSGLDASAQAGEAPSTLGRIKERDHVRCAVPTSLAGFAEVDGRGRWSGFDVDICRALAAAVFDDPDRIATVPMGGSDHVAALRNDRVDIVPRMRLVAGYDQGADTIALAGVTFFDGPGFLTPVGKPSALHSPTVCLVEHNRTEQELADHFANSGTRHLLWTWTDYSDAVETYLEGRCDTFSDSVSNLVVERSMTPRPDAHRIQPIVELQHAYRMAIQTGDADWMALVGRVTRALVRAEELSLTRERARSAGGSVALDPARAIGLIAGDVADELLMRRVVSHVGHYGEIFERTLGAASIHRLERGTNALMRDGGRLGID
jgi:general L-amino acid transport system substrate-binding protein